MSSPSRAEDSATREEGGAGCKLSTAASEDWEKPGLCAREDLPEHPAEAERGGAEASTSDSRSGVDEAGLSLTTKLYYQLSTTYHVWSASLGLKRLSSMFQPRFTSSPVWVLGTCYDADAAQARGQSHNGPRKSVDADDAEPQADGAQPTATQTARADAGEIQQAIRDDVESKLWFTYRTGFPPLGPDGLVSDTGWACTLRSGQMLLGQCVLHHHVGREWRASSEYGTERVRQLLQHFCDMPEEQYAASIHTICRHGKQHGLQVGKWISPFVMCQSIATLLEQPVARDLNLTAHVAAGPDGACGGAPNLCPKQMHALLDSAAAKSRSSNAPGLLLLVPLVLGVGGVVNPVYLEQLRAALRCSMSVGIVGGRPGASLFFIGFQGDSLIYLDPHSVQTAHSPPFTDAAAATYHCRSIQHMPMSQLDSTLALGFHCATHEALSSLLSELSAISVAGTALGAPMLTVGTPSTPPLQESPNEGHACSEDDWQLL